MLIKICVLVIGYLIGAIVQAGYWIGKINKIDIRDHGSGNAGTTNVMRTLGKKAGFITYFCDMFKAVLAGLLIHFVWIPVSGTCVNEMTLFLYSGLGIILGHNFPFYLKFKGGKGIAASSGFVISLLLFDKYCFMFTVVGVLSFFIVLFTTKYVSLGSIIGMTLIYIQFLIWSLLGWLPLCGFELIEGNIIVFVMSALAIIRHRSNIVRLLNGTERKIGQKKNN